ARQRESILHLAQLLDYQLRPGAAAFARLAFTLDRGATVPIPTGLRVQSVPGPGEQPQKYETLESLQADARWNRLRLLPAPAAANPLQKGSTAAWLAPGEAGLAIAASLSPGDRFLLFSAAEVEELAVRDLRVEDDRIELSWTSPVQGLGWDAA